jgi:NAD(P)-dependent dehydrogenase (short-subunit alcohol dehydrogenase family)
MTRVWFITGATRGIGSEIAKAVLGTGDLVVATGRKLSAIQEALGPDSDRLLALELDVTDAAQARTALEKAVSRFGSVDVLVNNAGYGQYGFFEESAPQDARDQLATNLFGVFNVTWAALPAMRAAGRGQIFNFSSLGGLIGAPFGSLYCASKFAVEGFSEALAKEVAPFGIKVTIVEPGPFRSEFLASISIRFGKNRIPAYDDRRAELLAGLEERNGRQPGDPAKLADAIIALANSESPPLRFLAGSFAVKVATEKLAGMLHSIETWHHLSSGTDGTFDHVSSGSLQQLVR